VLDTRKTLPGLRQAQKYAVRVGGGQNQRLALWHGILIKENHIAAAGGIAPALQAAAALGSGVPVQIEVESLDELRQALASGATSVLLDDFTPDNGAMMVVPRTHTGPIYDHTGNGVFCGAMDPTRIDLDLKRDAVPLLARAGSITLHHARLVHGSALNTSGRPRNFLLYEAMAADAWPLAGGSGTFTDLAEFDARMLCGEPTLQPRMTSVPVRMPLPKAPDHSSLYQSQKHLGNRFFDVAR
jgi:hypothetical protein